MKIDLKIKRDRHCDDRLVTLHWKQAPPFLVNPRGVLVHRVRYARTHIWHFSTGTESHHSCTFWCNNQCHGEREDFVEVPPTDRLLCAVCEANAVAHGQKTADELAGRHVHIGGMRAHRVCCKPEKN